MQIDFDPDSMTIEEVELAEEITDLPIDDWGKPGVKKGKIMRAMAYIAMRRTDPDTKLEDVGTVKASAFDEDDHPLPEPERSE